MGEMKDAHIVEIGVDAEQKLVSEMSSLTAILDHPLTEISNSPGHLLLLKLWQREEELCGRRVGCKEWRMESIKHQLFQLCCFFFVFHGIFLTLLFTSWVNNNKCKRWWIPSVISVFTSLVFVVLVQVKLCRYWKVRRQLERERSDGRAVARCVQELRMKGGSFHLSKEPQFHQKSGKKRINNSSWRPITWCSQYLITISLLCFTGFLFPASKLMLCGF